MESGICVFILYTVYEFAFNDGQAIDSLIKSKVSLLAPPSSIILSFPLDGLQMTKDSLQGVYSSYSRTLRFHAEDALVCDEFAPLPWNSPAWQTD